jgi:SAM-dependent MidA family methyltransferase
MPLPRPDDAALAHSRALAGRISEAIAAAGGWIGFDSYMQRALYEPGLGYYSSAARKFGAAGDFVTAPLLSPLFADCVARQLSQWFGEVPAHVVEFGAGTGALAARLLTALERLGTPAASYSIVELSADLRQLQQQTIARDAPGQLPVVAWLDRIPAAIDGVVLGNELLDAMPVRVFEAHPDRLYEAGVSLVDGGGFGWRLQDADESLRDGVASALSRTGAVHGQGGDFFGRLADEAGGRYRSELGVQAQAWVATVARALRHGAMLLVDYGFPAREYFHPQRSDGTLVCHYRHQVHADPFFLPGLQDITAHVDFSAIADAARAEGLELLGYAPQARFLIDCGLIELLQADERDDATGSGVARVRRLAAVQTLLSEAEMGELFKAIAFGRGIAGEAIGFVGGDRSAALAADGAR